MNESADAYDPLHRAEAKPERESLRVDTRAEAERDSFWIAIQSLRVDARLGNLRKYYANHSIIIIVF